MNARQKAKKLKKELELIKSRAPKITGYNTDVKTYNKGYFDALSEMENNKNRGSDKGKWIYEPNCWLRCSCCGYHYPHTSIYSSKMDWNYCPNCGKEMEDE